MTINNILQHTDCPAGFNRISQRHAVYPLAFDIVARGMLSPVTKGCRGPGRFHGGMGAAIEGQSKFPETREVFGPWDSVGYAYRLILHTESRRHFADAVMFVLVMNQGHAVRLRVFAGGSGAALGLPLQGHLMQGDDAKPVPWFLHPHVIAAP